MLKISNNRCVNRQTDENNAISNYNRKYLKKINLAQANDCPQSNLLISLLASLLQQCKAEKHVCRQKFNN